jgi:hypothetical protein
MQGTARVKGVTRAVYLCDESVGEKIVMVVGGWRLVAED